MLCYYYLDIPDYSVYSAGGAGVILMLDSLNDTAFAWFNPATVISSKQGELVFSYINSAR